MPPRRTFWRILGLIGRSGVVAGTMTDGPPEPSVAAAGRACWADARAVCWAVSPAMTVLEIDDRWAARICPFNASRRWAMSAFAAATRLMASVFAAVTCAIAWVRWKAIKDSAILFAHSRDRIGDCVSTSTSRICVLGMSWTLSDRLRDLGAVGPGS